jgi:hypothetical protein
MRRQAVSSDMRTVHWHNKRPAIRLVLDLEAATWIAEKLPQNDGATRELWREIHRAEEALTALKETP